MEGKVCIMAAMMRFFRPFFVLMLSGAACMAAQGQEQIIPRPVSVKYGETGPEGGIVLDAGSRVVCREKDPGFQKQARFLQQFLAQGTGLALDGPGGTNAIRIEKDASLKQYGPEAYRLEVKPGLISIRAASPRGVYYAGQSLAQMLPPAFFQSSADKSAVAWKVAEKPFSMLD